MRHRAFFLLCVSVPLLELQGEVEDLNMLYDGLGSMIHEEGEPEHPSKSSCKSWKD